MSSIAELESRLTELRNKRREIQNDIDRSRKSIKMIEAVLKPVEKINNQQHLQTE